MIVQLSIDPHKINVGTRYRTDNEVDEEFLDSIRDKGILQPITVDEAMNLVAGGRRLAAARQLGLTEVPVLVRAISDELDLRECELIENAFRRDLNWLDRNNLVNRINELMEEKHGKRGSQARTAELLNKSVGGISRHVALNKALSMFPKLAECKTEDEAVKLFRKLSEKVIAKQLVKDHVEQSAKASESKIEESLGITLARNAADHYNVGDAFEGMQYMLDEGLRPPIALVELDPPYAIDLQDVKKGDDRKNMGEYNEIAKEDYIAFLSKMLDYCHKVTPASCRFIIWHAVDWYSEITGRLRLLGYEYDTIPCIWVKPSGQTASPDRYLARCYESFIVAWKGSVPPIPKRGRSNVFEYNTAPHSQKYHPTQRPVELMAEVLRTFAYPGSIIMIPFLGSGATLRACYRLGMTGFGWDLSEVYKEHFLAAVQTDITDGSLKELELDEEKEE